MNFANVKSITIPEGKVKKIILGEGAGYTNLFSTSGSGFVQESDTEFLTNWMPYDRNDNNGKGTMYHFKGLTASNSPYKVHWATDANGTSASALAYCKNSDTPPTTSDYDVNVKIYQHHSGSDTHKFIQFEIRETVPDDFVITANEPIEAGGVVLWEAVSYTNRLPLAINADGTPYVGANGEKGYKTGYRLNSSRNEVQATNRCCTGFIAAKPSDTIRMENIYHPTDNNLNGYIHIYDSKFVAIGGGYEGVAFKLVNGACEFVVNNITLSNGTVADMAYFRISTGKIDSTSIITVNEEIT